MAEDSLKIANFIDDVSCFC